MEYLIHEVGSALELLRAIWSIGHKAAGLDHLPILVACRQTGVQRQGMNENMLRDDEGIVVEIERVGAPFESIEGRRDFLDPSNFYGDRSEAKIPCSRLDLLRDQAQAGTAAVRPAWI